MPSRVGALVTALLLEKGSPVSSGHLIDALWDEAPPSARANIRTYLTALRRWLIQMEAPRAHRLDTIRRGTADSSYYRLNAHGDEIDLWLFRKFAQLGHRALFAGTPRVAEELFRRALELWRGPAGVDVAGSARLRRCLEALDEQRILVQEQWIPARLLLGEAPVLVPEIRLLLAAHPLREGCWVNLLRALYLTGNVAAALEAYRQACAILESELGVGPSAELRQLHVAMLRRDDISTFVV